MKDEILLDGIPEDENPVLDQLKRLQKKIAKKDARRTVIAEGLSSEEEN